MTFFFLHLFLKKHCRFGLACKYNHILEYEVYENLKYLIEKEVKNTKESLKQKDDAIAMMAKQITNLKKDKESLQDKVKVSKNENEKLNIELRKVQGKD